MTDDLLNFTRIGGTGVKGNVAMIHVRKAMMDALNWRIGDQLKIKVDRKTKTMMIVKYEE